VAVVAWLSCVALAWVLYRLCTHHPRRWRAPRLAALVGGVLLAAACWLAARSTGTGGAVAFFVVLTLSMLWLALLPLLATWWRLRRGAGRGA